MKLNLRVSLKYSYLELTTEDPPIKNRFRYTLRTTNDQLRRYTIALAPNALQRSSPFRVFRLSLAEDVIGDFREFVDLDGAGFLVPGREDQPAVQH
jgi:hypothetical protein